MNESQQHFSPESIDQQTERVFEQLPAQDSRLMAELYQTYAPVAQAQSRSLQRIWNRFAQQMREQSLLSQEGQTEHLDAPVHGSIWQSSQPLPRGARRSFGRKLGSGMAVAVVLLLVVNWVLLTRAFPMERPSTSLGSSLTLDASLQHLTQQIVFLVKSSEGGQYLAAMSYDRYDGNTWSTSAVSSLSWPANKRIASEGSSVYLVTQQITLVNPSPGAPFSFIVGAGQIASVNQPTTLRVNEATGSLLAVLNNNQRTTSGDHYTVQSYVSAADIAALRAIPLPAHAPKLPSNYHGPLPLSYYNPAILAAYLQLPHIDPRVKALALQLTRGAPTMYDKAVALENYFRTSFTYSTTVSRSAGAEATAWLLFQSHHRAFCNYFATALAVMARELGMPARVTAGYTSGTFDSKAQDWVVHGSDAHAWTQIYFAGYGWINFEPSPGFSLPVSPL